MPKFKQTCPTCNYVNIFKVSWIDPELFTDPEKAQVSRAAWCSSCGTLVGTKYKFLDKDTIEVLDTFLPTPKGVPPVAETVQDDHPSEPEDKEKAQKNENFFDSFEE